MGYTMKGSEFFGKGNSSPLNHKPKSSGTWDAKFGTKPEKDTHKHPHTKEVQDTADWAKKGDPRYKDAKSGYERTMETSPRKDTQLMMDMHTRSEKRSLSDAEAAPEYFKPIEKERIKNPKWKKQVQKLSRQARADKKVRDLAAANTRDREIKRAENQRYRRAAIKAGVNIKDKDYDHKDNKFKPASENRAGTKNE